MSTEHTPTPWRFRMMGSEGGRIFPDTPDKREAVKYIALVNGRDFHADQANGEFIVRAVNSHQALVNALEAAALIVGYECDHEALAKANKLIDEALSLARGEMPHAAAELAPVTRRRA